MTNFNVWEFRVRYHLKQHRDTKASRKALRVKFGKDKTPLIDAFLAQYDAAAEYRKAADACRDRVSNLLALTSFLDYTDAVFSGDDEEGRKLPDVPKELETSFSELLATWKKATAKMRTKLRPYESASAAVRKRATVAHTKWQRALTTTKHEHAKSEGIESEE